MLNHGGIVIGPSHNQGGVHFQLDTGRHIEEEGMEINIPRELAESDQIFTFHGTNASVLNKILSLAGLSITDKVTNVRSGDIVICVRSAWDDTERKFVGTIEEILDQINTSKGCKPIINSKVKSQNSKVTARKGMRIPMKQRIRDEQIENPNSARWKKKKERISELSNTIHRLRLNASRDIQSDDEKLALTALVVAVMDKTAERIGNDDSADNGHFGVTGFQKKHIHVVGNKVHLEYIGKSGMKHEKSFSDERIAKALKQAIKNSKSKFIFETSDGFRIKADKVNRYLEQFKISAKDMRGYLANRWMVNKLKSAVLSPAGGGKGEVKERKRIFNKALKQTAGEVGHGTGTLKKHYLIPELQSHYVENGNIIDMKNLGYFADGSIIEKNNKINFVKNIPMEKSESREVGKYIREINDLAAKKKLFISDYIPIISQDESGRIGWSFDKRGIKVGDKVILADGKTKSTVLEVYPFEIGSDVIGKSIDVFDSKKNKFIQAKQLSLPNPSDKNIDLEIEIGGKPVTAIWNHNEKRWELFSDTPQFDDGGKLAVANEIRNQVGHKTLYMLGAKDLAGDEYSFSFKIRGSKKWKHIKIFLNGKDLYDVTFTTWRGDKLTKKTVNDVYADNLHKVIEEETGLYTKLAEGGEIEKAKLKYAKEDIELVTEEGAMAITDTKYGLLHLEFENGIYTIKSNEYNFETFKHEVLFKGDKNGAIQFLKNAYSVEGDIQLPKHMLNEDGGKAGDCGCFRTFLIEQNPELCERLVNQNVNEVPELRQEVDEAYQAWQGGKM